MKTHRCVGVRMNQTPIRYDDSTNKSIVTRRGWWINKVEDGLFGEKYLVKITRVQYCPYCGKELE